MEKIIKNKVVIVTGGSRGIGLSIAEVFLQEKAKNVIILDIKEQVGIEVTNKLNVKYGVGKVIFFKCDVTTDLNSVFNKILDQFRFIDVLVNNAGVVDETSIRKTISVNTIATIEWTMMFWNHARKDKGGNSGTVINISSIYGYMVDPFTPFYKASKHAIIGFSRTIGHKVNYEQTGVRVITICPTFTNSPLVNDSVRSENFQFLDSRFKNLLENIKWLETDDVSKATVEVFKIADSGTVWCKQGGKPVEELTVSPNFCSEFLFNKEL